MKTLLYMMLAAAIHCLTGATAYAASLADFVRPVQLVDIQISPDGQHLAMLRREGKDTLYVVKRADNSIVNGISSSEGQRFHAFRWANDNRLLIEPAVELDGYAHALPTGALLAVSIDGKKNGFLRRSKAAEAGQMFSIVNLLTNDPDHVLVTRRVFLSAGADVSAYVRRENALGLTTAVIAVAKSAQGFTAVDCDDGCVMDAESPPTLEKLNIYTGQSEIVLTAPSARGEFVTDATAQKVMFTGLDSGLVSIYESDVSQDWEEIKYFTQYYDLGATPIGFDRSGGIMALDNLVDTLGVSRLGGDGEVQSVFRDKVADIDNVVRARDGTFLAASFSAGFPSWYYHEADSAFAETHQALRTAYPDSDIAITSFTDGGTEAVVRVYSDKNAGEYYIVNLETRKTEDLMRQIDWLEDDELVATHPVQIPTRDGFEIYGYLSLPKTANNLPSLIVVTHQHPFSAKFEWGYDARAQMFANAGYAVLQLNTRGAPGYGHRYTTGSDVELDSWTDHDIVDAVQWAGTQELVDPNKACLFGSGRGAYGALLTAMRNPGKFRCVVAADGEYTLADLAASSNPARPFAASVLRARDAGQVPWFDEIIDRATRLQTPTLIVSEGPALAARQLVEKSKQSFAQHVVGVTNLNRVTKTDELMASYQRILEFFRGSFAADLPTKDFQQSLRLLLTSAERDQLEKVLNKVYKDIQRAIRARNEKNLPPGLVRKVDSNEKVRRAERALSGRDKEVRKVLPEQYWPAYESFKRSYSLKVEKSIQRGAELPPYLLSGPAG